MVAPRDRSDNRNANKLQGVGVPPVQGSEKVPVPHARPLWTIGLRPFRIHYNHVQDGQEFDERCPLCSKRLESFVVEVETEVPFDDVAARDRSDKESAAALARDSVRDEESQEDKLW